jgi:hypothetical protein
MVNVTLPTRIANCIAALGICWFVSGIASGLCYRDARVSFLMFLWSVPFFVAGFVLVGIPIVAIGNRILKIPKILLGLAGAVGGAFVILLPALVLWAGSLGSEHFRLDWAYLKGWPAFGAGIGVSGVILYSWLLSREVKRASAKINTDCS